MNILQFLKNFTLLTFCLFTAASCSASHTRAPLAEDPFRLIRVLDSKSYYEALSLRSASWEKEARWKIGDEVELHLNIEKDGRRKTFYAKTRVARLPDPETAALVAPNIKITRHSEEYIRSNATNALEAGILRKGSCSKPYRWDVSADAPLATGEVGVTIILYNSGGVVLSECYGIIAGDFLLPVAAEGAVSLRKNLRKFIQFPEALDINLRAQYVEDGLIPQTSLLLAENEKIKKMVLDETEEDRARMNAFLEEVQMIINITKNMIHECPALKPVMDPLYDAMIGKSILQLAAIVAYNSLMGKEGPVLKSDKSRRKVMFLGNSKSIDEESELLAIPLVFSIGGEREFVMDLGVLPAKPPFGLVGGIVSIAGERADNPDTRFELTVRAPQRGTTGPVGAGSPR